MTENRDLIQGSPEWHAARIGKITGSRFKDVLSTRGAGRGNYMRELLLERKTGRAAVGFTNTEMEWGTEHEPQARAYYEKWAGVTVEQVGFIDHPQELYNGYVGVSPDGLVGPDGCVEIKCPNTDTHLEYIAKAVVPTKYIPQIQGTLWVTCRQWCDFISFDPRVPEQPFFCVRVQRDQPYINKLAAAVDEFIQEMVEMQKNQVEVDPQLLIDVTGGCNENDWQLKFKDEIRSKVRMHITERFIEAGLINLESTEKHDAFIMNRIIFWTDFAITGE